MSLPGSLLCDNMLSCFDEMLRNRNQMLSDGLALRLHLDRGLLSLLCPNVRRQVLRRTGRDMLRKLYLSAWLRLQHEWRHIVLSARRSEVFGYLLSRRKSVFYANRILRALSYDFSTAHCNISPGQHGRELNFGNEVPRLMRCWCYQARPRLFSGTTKTAKSTAKLRI